MNQLGDMVVSLFALYVVLSVAMIVLVGVLGLMVWLAVILGDLFFAKDCPDSPLRVETD
jgi:O-antigen ligase